MTPNRYKVPKKPWGRWSALRRHVFNELYRQMIQSPWMFLSPQMAMPKRDHWRVIAWNAAWIAGESTKEAV